MSDMQKKNEGTEPLHLTEQQKRRLRQRNLALAWVLTALVTLFFVVTIAKLGGNVADRPI
jgi:hypothetical protein